MSAARASPRMSVRQGLSTVLAVVGIVAVAVGLMYLFAGSALPHLLQGQAHTGRHIARAGFCLVVGAGCAVVAWLVRDRPG